jgi:hypothetical protein
MIASKVHFNKWLIKFVIFPCYDFDDLGDLATDSGLTESRKLER